MSEPSQGVPGAAGAAAGESQGERRVRVGLPLGARTPWATRVLLALNVAIFAVPWLLTGVTGQPIDELVLTLGAQNGQLIAEYGEYYRLLTAMFLHANLTHIAFNAWALYSLGSDAERIYGTRRFLAVYFLGGLAGAAASYALRPGWGVGASGAIFGVAGALAAFYYVGRGVMGGMARQQLGSLMFIVAINVGFGLTNPQIGNEAHIGGLVGGALAGWLLAPRFRIDAQQMQPRAERTYLAAGWPGALGILAALAAAVALIRPPQ